MALGPRYNTDFAGKLHRSRIFSSHQAASLYVQPPVGKSQRLLLPCLDNDLAKRAEILRSRLHQELHLFEVEHFYKEI